MKKYDSASSRKSILDETDWLFEMENSGGVFPALYLFYSYKKGLKNWLDDKEISNNDADNLQYRLFRATDGFFGGDIARLEKLTKMYEKMKALGLNRFGLEYVPLIEELLCRTPLVGGTAQLPDQRIATTIFNILKERGCKSVMTAYSGAGSFVTESKGISYKGVEPYNPHNLIAEVLADAYGIESYSFSNLDPVRHLPRETYDAVIGNMPVDADFFNETRADHLLPNYIDRQFQFLNKLLRYPYATKIAAILVHFQLAHNQEYDYLRKTICEQGLLDTVIALPESIFALATVPTYIIILDMAGGRNQATFIDATNSPKSISHTISANRIDLRDGSRAVSVSYSQIDKTKWAFNPFIYIQDAVAKDGQELVRLGDIASFTKGNFNAELYLDPNSFSDKKQNVLKGLTPTVSSNPWDRDGRIVEGPSILLSLSSGKRRQEQNLLYGVCKERDIFRTAFYVSVLKPNPNKIIPEYLALALMDDPSFSLYYKNIQEYYTDPIRGCHLLERLVPIFTDLAEQRKNVEMSRDRAVMEDAQYNIILAGLGERVKPFSRVLSDFKCNVQETSNRVEGPDGLEAILENATKERVSLTRHVDAVIFTTDIAYSGNAEEQPLSGMDAVIDLQHKYDSRGIVFYAISRNGLEELEKVFFPRRLKYFKEGHFFQIGDENGTAALVQALRQELDTLHSDSAQIRTKYRDVMVAADWIDANFEGNEVSEVLSDFLIAKEFGKDSLRKLSTLRTVAHNLIDILKKWNIVPDAIDLDQGAIPHLIYDQKYETKLATYYYWDDTVMPKSHSAALIALIEIGNEGTHTFNTNPQLGATMLNTLMAFILWLYNGRDSLPQRKTPWYKESLNERIQIDDLPMTGTVKQVTVKGKRIWVCGNVHLQEPADGDIREGDTVIITRVKPETKFNTPEINALAFRDCYTIDKTKRE